MQFTTFSEGIIVFLLKKKKNDEHVFLTKNKIVALKQEQFKVTRRLVGLQKLPPDVPGYEVNLANIITWAIREMWLHSFASSEVVSNLKADGRPFFGKPQVVLWLYVPDFLQ